MTNLRRVTAGLMVLVIGFGLGMSVGPGNEAEAAVIVNGFGSGKNDDPTGEVPLTPERVKRKLLELDHLTTFSGTYTVETSMDSSRYFFEATRLPAVTDTLSFLCEGVVTVGYSVNEMEPQVDNMNRVIQIHLPKAEILDYYVIWSSLNTPEKTSPFSPMAFAEYQGLMMNAKGKLLAQAKSECIYERAEVTVQTVIRNHLSGCYGYKIVFV